MTMERVEEKKGEGKDIGVLKRAIAEKLEKRRITNRVAYEKNLEVIESEMRESEYMEFDLSSPANPGV